MLVGQLSHRCGRCWRSRFDKEGRSVAGYPMRLDSVVHFECERMEEGPMLAPRRRRAPRRRLTSPYRQRALVAFDGPGYEDGDRGVCTWNRAGQGGDEADADIIAVAGP